MLARERESLRFFSSDVDCNSRSSHHGYKSATPLGGSVECIGQRQVGYRLECDCDVGRRKCDKLDHLR